MTVTGRVGWQDGTNVQHAISVAGSGATAPTAPVSGNVVTWGSTFTQTDAGFLVSNVVRKDVANTYAPIAFASLGTPADGTLIYCNNCTIASPCASGGTGAFAKRLNGVWVCN